jgi:ankyrin repeat protein
MAPTVPAVSGSPPPPSGLSARLLRIGSKAHGPNAEAKAFFNTFLNAVNKKGQTALMLAASAGKVEVVELLLREGASPFVLVRSLGM